MAQAEFRRFEMWHLCAADFYQCEQDFSIRDRFSPVPYNLLFTCLEVEIKARHLEQGTVPEKIKGFNHSLTKAYEALNKKPNLNNEQRTTLKRASENYENYRYFEADASDVLAVVFQGKSNEKPFPNLESLRSIAKMLLEDSGYLPVTTQ